MERRMANALDRYGPEGDAIAHCKGSMVDNKANARLIAAAPELLERLRELIKSADELATCGPRDEQRWIDQVLEDCELAQAAIAKAEGEKA